MTHSFALMADALTLFAQQRPLEPAGDPAAGAGGAAAAICPLVFGLVVLVIVVVSAWKVFTKAGQPGWAAIVPIYNTYVLTCEVAKKEVLWFALSLIPCVNIVASFVVSMEVARKFGKSEAFGIGLVLLPFVFYPILAFGDARYQGGRAGRDDRGDELDDDRSRRRRDDDDAR